MFLLTIAKVYNGLAPHFWLENFYLLSFFFTFLFLLSLLLSCHTAFALHNGRKREKGMKNWSVVIFWFLFAGIYHFSTINFWKVTFEKIYLSFECGFKTALYLFALVISRRWFFNSVKDDNRSPVFRDVIFQVSHCGYSKWMTSRWFHRFLMTSREWEGAFL